MVVAHTEVSVTHKLAANDIVCDAARAEAPCENMKCKC